VKRELLRNQQRVRVRLLAQGTANGEGMSGAKHANRQQVLKAEVVARREWRGAWRRGYERAYRRR